MVKVLKTRKLTIVNFLYDVNFLVPREPMRSLGRFACDPPYLT